MLENAIGDFIDSIFLYITSRKRTKKGAIIKTHSENLHIQGDFSFPNSLKSWQGLLEYTHQCRQGGVTDLLNRIESTESLITYSENWCLQISKVTLEHERICVHLNRSKAITFSMLKSEGYYNCVLHSIQRNILNVPVTSCETADDLTSLRVRFLRKSIENLYAVAASTCSNRPVVFITFKSSSKGLSDCHIVICGTVLNAKTGLKESSICADDYIQIRENEMSLIAQHKYGIRISSDSKWKEYLKHLGNSAVKFELLQIKPSSSVKINFETCSTGSSKGAAFVLYNCARLETILRSYNQKVVEGSYPALPPITDVDFGLLTHEDEWTLVFNFILGFPALLSSCVAIEDNVCEFRPHHICSFLCSMVRTISQYYRKVRILTEPRKHLLPVMFARLYLLKSLIVTLKTCLEILNIKSVSQMYLFILFFLNPKVLIIIITKNTFYEEHFY